MFDAASLALLGPALQRVSEGHASLPALTTSPQPAADPAALAAVLQQVATRLQDNYPYAHPLYAGQMLKPPHPVARLAYALASFVNPNNHALDGGRASSAMEREAVAAIAAMFGWTQHLGHLTGGGTMANTEALWVADQLHPGRTIVASTQAHYTHARLTQVLKIPFRTVAQDARARMDLEALEATLAQGDVGTVVVTLGTTAAGAVDPLPQILRLRDRHGFRIHVDAAYGGYHRLAGNLGHEARAAFDAIGEADSIVVDPHKHGLQPYGCGCVLFKDPSVGRFYKHDSPYTYFSSKELHLGEISLECSRAGASAVALWATLQLFPLQRGGAFAQGLEAGREAALDLHRLLQADARFLTGPAPELDIVVWAPRGASASEISARSQAIFDAAAQDDLHLAVAQFPKSMFAHWPIDWDRDHVACLRSCLMKPEHRDWIAEIWRRLGRATDAVLS
ncbi:MAG: aminotransferase class I/II-fold pyridoxal phosphate-dependent enzyme [Rubrivivax sp.]